MTKEYDVMEAHFWHPKHEGLLEKATHRAHGFSKICRDEGEFTLVIEEGRVRQVGWEAKGCTFFRAAMSIVAQNASGHRASALLELTEHDIYRRFGMQAALRKPDCVAFPLELLKEAIRNG